MTDADKVLALTELLGEVMNTLELKQYLIEDPTESYECEFQANQFHQQMIEILYPESSFQSGTQTHHRHHLNHL
jgi:hypothetical protein